MLQHLKIVPLSRENTDFATTLLRAMLPKHASSLDTVNEGPEMCYRHALEKDSAAIAWASENGIDLNRLNYFVILDEGGTPLGVSGIYSTLPGYLERQGTDYPEIAARIQSPNHFWMGWTAVIPEMQGKKIGTLLMKHGVNLAQSISDTEGLQNPHWVILADAGAESFYEKRGFTAAIPHLTETIFVDSLSEATSKISGF